MKVSQWREEQGGHMPPLVIQPSGCTDLREENSFALRGRGACSGPGKAKLLLGRGGDGKAEEQVI